MFLAISLQLRRDAAVPGHNRGDEWQDERREFAKDKKDDHEDGDAPGVVAGAHHELEFRTRDLVRTDQGCYRASFIDAVLDGAGRDKVVVDVFETGFVK